ncbi:MAG: cell wall metabolism sensor histidine kinase WalK [SAR202 cluster bacterium]|nr:cell wall metabolism sensor histidine kinase WalK [SAR202 cluster bacterium]
MDRLLHQQSTVGALNERQLRYLETVQKNSYRLKVLLNDLLDVSRIEAGSLELKLEAVDVGREVEEVVTSMQTQIRQKQTQVSADIPVGKYLVRGDRLRFSQVITNLLSNAVKYSPAGAAVTLSASHADGNVEVRVADAGIGISADNQARLFTKFFRVDNTSTRQESGTGLGLYITKHLVEAHGGAIQVESQEGKGTSMRLLWPQAGAEAAGALAA